MEQNSSPTPFIKIASAVVLTVLMTACVPDGGDNESQADISGSVGDGPIIGATLNIYDNDGNLIQTEISDTSASYTARIKAKGNAFPLTIKAVGGTDLVTGRAPDFTLSSVVLDPSQKQVNINPFSTLIEQTAALMDGGLTEQNVAAATADVLGQLNFGLNPALVPDPIGSEISDLNIAATVKAAETLGEAIRRSLAALQQHGAVSSADEIVGALADDMSDGTLDGRGTGKATARVTDVFVLASAQTLIEALSNNLHVDGSPATDALDNAILMTRPTVSSSALTASVRINGEMLQQASSSVAAARTHAPSADLDTIAAALDGISVGSVASQIEPVLPPRSSQALDPVIALVASNTAGPAAPVDDNVVVEQPLGGGASSNAEPLTDTNSPPTIEGRPALAVNVGAGYRFQPSASDPDGDELTFDATNVPGWATFDTASGLLSGTPDDSDTGIYAEIVVTVSDGLARRSLPAFSISVNATTRTSSNTAPTMSGTPPSPALGSTELKWSAPVTRADGNALGMSEIAEYTLYYGTEAGNYTNSIKIDDPYTTSATVSDLPAGTYHFVITATDIAGLESGYSGVATRQIQ